MTNKIKKHTRGWFTAIVSMFVILFLVNSVIDSLDKFADFKERNSDVSEYFEYKEGRETVPTKEVFAVGENPTLWSNLEIKQPVQMQWDDTLYCDGQRYLTQTWREFRDKPSIQKENDGSFWAYSKEKVTKPREYCVVCSVAIATTARGYDKTTGFCSLPFSFEELSK